MYKAHGKMMLFIAKRLQSLQGNKTTNELE